MDTNLAPRSAAAGTRSPRRKWILASAVALSAAIFAAGPVGQESPPKKAAAADAQGKRAEAAQEKRATWNALLRPLFEAYYERHPDVAFQHGWPGAARSTLGTFGTEAAIRWKDALEDARIGFSRLDASTLPPLEKTHRRALLDWIERETVLLEALSPARSDPASYVQRVTRVLRAVAESALPEEERAKKLTGMLAQLSAYWKDAQKSLVAPCPEWIEVALRDLDDLTELVERLAPSSNPPADPSAESPAGRRVRPVVTPRAAIGAFRDWLLEMHSRSGSSPKALGSPAWTRLARLASGSTLTRGEIKARCLRDLADIGVTESAARRSGPQAWVDVPQPESIARGAAAASAKALAFAKGAKLLESPFGEDALRFAFEASPRTGTALCALRADARNAVLASIELPSASWSTSRSSARMSRFLPRAQVALGVRFGLVGEAHLFLSARAERNSLVLLEGNPALREGFGLFALDWVTRRAGEASFDDPKLAHEFGALRAFEAARLLAALELHAEGVSATEAILAFQRRTGLDADSARAETFAALRDPATGLGYLVSLELRALTDELAAEQDASAALGRTLALASHHPALRPADLREVASGSFTR